MMEQNLTFLKNTHFGKWIELNSQKKQEVLGNYLDEYSKSIDSLEEPFKSFVLKAFGFDGLASFIKDPKLFFTALPNIPKYEAFVDILESIFGTRKININEQIDGIAIEIISAGADIKTYYVDRLESGEEIQLVDKDNKEYIGFKNGDYSSLNWFFLHLLKRFVTAGIVVKSLTVAFE